MAANDPQIHKRNASDTGFEEVNGALSIRDILGVGEGDSPTFAGIQFDTSGSPTLAEGMVRWDAQSRCLEYGVSATESISIGQELSVRARNSTGSTLANGTPVYIVGATGNRPTIAKADADAIGTSQTLIGLVTDSAGIANNADGRVTVLGLVNDLDTSAYSEGAVVYLSAGTAGTLTATKPTTEGQFVVRVGYVTRAHATQGSILVAPHYQGSVTGDAVMNATTAAAARDAIYSASTAESWLPVAECTFDIVAESTHTLFTAATGRVRYEAAEDTSCIRIAFIGSYNTSSAEAVFTNPMELKCALEGPDGVTLPIFFYGRRMALIRPGQLLISDPIYIPLERGDEFWVRCFQSRLSSAAYTNSSGEIGLLTANQTNVYYNSVLKGRSSINNNGEQYALTTSTGIDPYTVDFVDGTGTTSLGATATVQFLKPLVLGQAPASARRSLGIVGTSIDRGTGEQNFGLDVGGGYVARACNQMTTTRPSLNIAIGGSSYVSQWIPYGKMNPRGVLLDYVDVVAIGGPTNDMGDALATIQASVTTLADRFKAAGKYVVMATVFPRTTSSNGWINVAGQSDTAESTKRLDYNAWLRATPPASCDLVIDPWAGVADATTGRWREATLVSSGNCSTGGSGFITVPAATWTAQEYAGYLIVNTSTGATGYILSHTDSAMAFVMVGAVAWTNGQGYAIYRGATYDGVHPTGWGHQQAADAIRTTLQTAF